MVVDNKAYAAFDAKSPLALWDYQIREPEENEVLVRVLYCGICHSDIHSVRSEWSEAKYPLVAGHEFVGEVCRLGPGVSKHKVGDKVGVGCLVASCLSCRECKMDDEQHCAKSVGTYGSVNKGQPTYGGYGKYVVLHEHFAVPIPMGMDIKDIAPIFCAGITTYTPAKRNRFERGNLKIGIIGLGGLGHMAVQWAAKMNPTNEVWGITRGKGKEALARELGAVGCIETSNEADVEKHTRSFDYLMDTVTVADKPMKTYAKLLRPRGVLIEVALPPVKDKVELPLVTLMMGSKEMQTSVIGGIKDTAEMLEFAHKHSIKPMVEHIKAEQVNEAYERVVKADVKFRFVIDVADSY